MEGTVKEQMCAPSDLNMTMNMPRPQSAENSKWNKF